MKTEKIVGSHFIYLFESFQDVTFLIFSHSEQLRCSYTRPTEDQYLIYGDKVTNAYSEQTCKQSCSQESEFNCRSYSFRKDVSHMNHSHFDIVFISRYQLFMLLLWSLLTKALIPFQNRPGSQCLLSSDTQSIAGRNAFQISNGALYSEKDCSSRSNPRGQSFRPFETRPKGVQNQSLVRITQKSYTSKLVHIT